MIIKYFIPSKQIDGKDIPAEKREVFKEYVIRFSCKENGGATVYQAKGYYQTRDAELIKEDVEVIETVGNGIIPDFQRTYFKEYLKQESIGIQIDGIFAY